MLARSIRGLALLTRTTVSQIGVSRNSAGSAQADVQLSWFTRRQMQLSATIGLSSAAGRWRYDVTLVAEAPAARSTILCEAHLGQSVRVPLELYAPGAPLLHHATQC